MSDVSESLSKEDCAALEARIGHTFTDSSLLLRALTHPSWLQRHPKAGGHNQRLEFLGDAILGAVIAEELFRLLPKEREGTLSRSLHTLVRGQVLSELAQGMELAPCLRHEDNIAFNSGRGQASLMEDALEAIAGAVYLDAGWERAREVILGWFGDVPARLEQMETSLNPKGRLQERVQPALGNEAIRYTIEDIHGPDHDRWFTAKVYIDKEESGEGTGRSKKEAEEEAARQALLKWQPPTDKAKA